MPQGSVTDANGDVVWKFDICCEFDCNEEYAASRGIKCGGDFTHKPCMFHGEHLELNKPREEQDE